MNLSIMIFIFGPDESPIYLMYTEPAHNGYHFLVVLVYSDNVFS